MGRFRIGKNTTKEIKVMPTTNNQVVEIEKKVYPDLSHLITKDELDSRLSNLSTTSVNIPSSVEKIIEKTEVVKELISIKTKDQRVRQFAKLVRKKMKHLHDHNQILEKKLEQIQHDEILSRKIDQASLTAISNQLKELKASHLMVKSEIDKEIQQLKNPKMHPITLVCLAISLSLSLLAILLNK